MRKNLFLVYAALLLSVAAALVIWMIVVPDAPADPSTKPLPLPVGFRSEMLADQASDGAVIFIKTCGQCHNLPNPKMHTDKEWPGVVGRMDKRLILRKSFYQKSLFVPNDNEHRLMVAYLSDNGIRQASANTLRDTEPVAVLFRARCTQCHALPDPSQHTAAEWPDIVARMRQNIQKLQDIEKFRRIPITEDESNQIVTFLSAWTKKG